MLEAHLHTCIPMNTNEITHSCRYHVISQTIPFHNHAYEDLQRAAHSMLTNLQHCAWPFLSSRTNVILSAWLFQEHFHKLSDLQYFQQHTTVRPLFNSSQQVLACPTECRECVFWQRIQWWQQRWGDQKSLLVTFTGV